MIDPQVLGDLIRRGMDNARAKGRLIGRPRSEREPEIERLLRAGWPAERVRKELHVGTETVRRVVMRLRAERA